MIRFYHCNTERSFAPFWTLEELGIPYELEMLPFPARVITEDSQELDRGMTAPFLVDEKTQLTESMAICQYLAMRYGAARLVVAADEPAYGSFLDWLHGTVIYSHAIVVRDNGYPRISGAYAKWFLDWLQTLEAATAGSESLCAGRFTIADIAVGSTLRRAESMGLSRMFGPNVSAYWQRLQAREGFKRSINAETMNRAS